MVRHRAQTHFKIGLNAQQRSKEEGQPDNPCLDCHGAAAVPRSQSWVASRRVAASVKGYSAAILGRAETRRGETGRVAETEEKLIKLGEQSKSGALGSPRVFCANKRVAVGRKAFGSARLPCQGEARARVDFIITECRVFYDAPFARQPPFFSPSNMPRATPHHATPRQPRSPELHQRLVGAFVRHTPRLRHALDSPRRACTARGCEILSRRVLSSSSHRLVQYVWTSWHGCVSVSQCVLCMQPRFLRCVFFFSLLLLASPTKRIEALIGPSQCRSATLAVPE